MSGLAWPGRLPMVMISTAVSMYRLGRRVLINQGYRTRSTSTAISPMAPLDILAIAVTHRHGNQNPFAERIGKALRRTFASRVSSIKQLGAGWRRPLAI